MISIKGIQLLDINIDELEKGEGGKMVASYNLMSSADRVLAKQSINGYNTVKVAFSPTTITALQALVTALKNDIEQVLGLVEG